jgi:hemerythrin
MPIINWKEDYSVGVKQLDEQHQRLISLINKLFLLFNDKKFNQLDVEPIFRELIKYADEHFGTEEYYFHLYDYEKKDEHIALHNAYRQKVEDLKKSYEENNNAKTLFAINNFLNDWWKWHINNVDKEYTNFFHANRIE